MNRNTEIRVIFIAAHAWLAAGMIIYDTTTKFVSTTSTLSKATCNIDGKEYEVGPMENFRDCLICECKGPGQITCVGFPCLLVQCVNPVYNKNTCCMECPAGPNCKAYDGTIIEAGKTYSPDEYTWCKCDQRNYFRSIEAECIAA